MTQQRFEAIVRCIHLIDNKVLMNDTRDPAYDKLGKVRWLVEEFS